jgi:hypothetical protein
MTRVPLLLVAGTYEWPHRASRTVWCEPEAAWYQYVMRRGFTTYRQPYVWDTGLDGVWPWRKLARWRASGINLKHWANPDHAVNRLDVLFIPRLTIIAYSHGLQPCLAAAGEGLYIDTLIDVGGPVRHDLMALYPHAMEHIGQFIHFHSHDDQLSWLGSIGDGVLGITRPHPWAHTNIETSTTGHGGILYNPQYFPLWDPILTTITQRYVRPDDSR